MKQLNFRLSTKSVSLKNGHNFTTYTAVYANKEGKRSYMDVTLSSNCRDSVIAFLKGKAYIDCKVDIGENKEEWTNQDAFVTEKTKFNSATGKYDKVLDKYGKAMPKLVIVKFNAGNIISNLELPDKSNRISVDDII